MVEIKCSRVLCMNVLHKHVIVAKTNESYQVTNFKGFLINKSYKSF